MNRTKLLELIEEIQNRNHNEFKGSNEADLHTREEIADLFEKLFESRLQLFQNSLEAKPLEGLPLEVLKKTSQRVLNYPCKTCGHYPCICNTPTI